jgi:hypothetical protein
LVHRRWLSDLVVPTETGKDRDGAPPPGIFRLVAIGELVGYKPCAILAASWCMVGECVMANVETRHNVNEYTSYVGSGYSIQTNLL